MNIKCPSCGHENQLGAIFCRNCGAKLDLEAMKPEVEDHKIAGAGLAGIARRLTIVLVFLIIVSFLAATMLPFGLVPYTVPSDDTVKQAKDKFTSLNTMFDAEKPSTHVFTPQEAATAFNAEVIGANKTAEQSYSFEHLMFDISASGEVAIDVDMKLYDKVPIRISLIGKPQITDGKATFNISSAKVGHVPVPNDYCKAFVASKLLPLLELPFSKKLLATAKSFEIDTDGNFVITLPGTAKKPAVKK